MGTSMERVKWPFSPWTWVSRLPPLISFPHLFLDGAPSRDRLKHFTSSSIQSRMTPQSCCISTFHHHWWSYSFLSYITSHVFARNFEDLLCGFPWFSSIFSGVFHDFWGPFVEFSMTFSTFSEVFHDFWDLLWSFPWLSSTFSEVFHDFRKL